jgi:probable DNA metabolism protein
MATLVYDGSFAGLLTAVFDVYEYKFTQCNITPEQHRQDSLFEQTHIVETDANKANRVWTGLKKIAGQHAVSNLYKTFLSEEEGMENHLLQYIRYTFLLKEDISSDYSHASARYINDTAKKVHREKHRMEAFVRFKLTKDGLYFATIEPDFNVLPLILPHFEKRYADQRWLIYDVRRKYGLYYDLHKTQFVEMSFNDAEGTPTNIAEVLEENEAVYQQLWQQYFHSVNIPARKNLKLHIKHMPYRYWKYLVEKHSGI